MNRLQRRWVRTIVGSTALALLIAGAATGPAGAGAPTKATCKLLKPAEIEEVIGQPVGKARKSRLRSNICEWPVTGTRGALISVLLDRGSTASSNFESAKDNSEAAGVEDVPGLGREAFAAQSIVWVIKNKNTAFYVQGLLGIDTVPQDQLVELARKALPRA